MHYSAHNARLRKRKVRSSFGDFNQSPRAQKMSATNKRKYSMGDTLHMNTISDRKLNRSDSSNINMLATMFNNADPESWREFLNLGSWTTRNRVRDILFKEYPTGYQNFLDSYKIHMKPFFLDIFYDIIENDMPSMVEKYAREGAIDVPLLKSDCLNQIAERSINLESKGNSRYNTTRTVYPPGEVKQWDISDPRKNLLSEVNLVAIGATKMDHDDIVQWIYHSPHLQQFVQRTMEMAHIYPYYSDLGVAVNIMKPSPNRDAKTALGFHFDTIDSSRSKEGESGNKNSRGATGVIGIQDCTIGGERVSFPGVNRSNVIQVKSIVESFDPLKPSKTIPIEEHSGTHQEVVPSVMTEPIAGMLSLFDGGDILHGVSGVREGVRVATVFLYCENDPVESQSTIDSSKAFYDEQGGK